MQVGQARDQMLARRVAVRRRTGSGDKSGVTAESWPGGTVCGPWLLCEDEEGLERNLLEEREKGNWGARTPTEPQGEEKALKQLILLVELFL